MLLFRDFLKIIGNYIVLEFNMISNIISKAKPFISSLKATKIS